MDGFQMFLQIWNPQEKSFHLVCEMSKSMKIWQYQENKRSRKQTVTVT